MLILVFLERQHRWMYNNVSLSGRHVYIHRFRHFRNTNMSIFDILCMYFEEVCLYSSIYCLLLEWKKYKKATYCVQKYIQKIMTRLSYYNSVLQICKTKHLFKIFAIIIEYGLVNAQKCTDYRYGKHLVMVYYAMSLLWYNDRKINLEYIELCDLKGWNIQSQQKTAKQKNRFLYFDFYIGSN